jgi:hypothetical protein
MESFQVGRAKRAPPEEHGRLPPGIVPMSRFRMRCPDPASDPHLSLEQRFALDEDEESNEPKLAGDRLPQPPPHRATPETSMPHLPKTKTVRDAPAQVSKKSPAAALTKRRIHSRGERAGVRGADALRATLPK